MLPLVHAVLPREFNVLEMALAVEKWIKETGASVVCTVCPGHS